MLFAVANGNQLTNQPQESQTIFLEDDWVLGIPLYRECWSVGIIRFTEALRFGNLWKARNKKDW